MLYGTRTSLIKFSCAATSPLPLLRQWALIEHLGTHADARKVMNCFDNLAAAGGTFTSMRWSIHRQDFAILYPLDINELEFYRHWSVVQVVWKCTPEHSHSTLLLTFEEEYSSVGCDWLSFFYAEAIFDFWSLDSKRMRQFRPISRRKRESKRRRDKTC